MVQVSWWNWQTVFKMLKGRRSSTPSQKEKEKSSEKVTKKQQRSVSTSAIKGNNSAAANLTSLSFSSYTTQNDSQDNSINNNNNNSSNGNNGHAVENGDHGHWIDHVCETVVLVLNESGGLHFEVGGGADEGKFPFVGRQRMKPEEAGISVQSLSQNGEIRQTSDSRIPRATSVDTTEASTKIFLDSKRHLHWLFQIIKRHEMK